jgi:hypothetical protein
MNCEPNEVNLVTLPPGAAFELLLSHATGIRCVVVQQLAGSTLVDCGAKKEHWCYDAPVVPHPEVTDLESWINSNAKENNEMATNGEKKQRKAKAAKEPKKLIVTQYEASTRAATLSSRKSLNG